MSLYNGVIAEFAGILSDEQIRREIAGSNRGSDIYGLVEKMAFYLHLNYPSDSQEGDWYFAQETLLDWSDSVFRPGLRDGPSFGKHITRLLNHVAYEKSRTREFFHDSPNSYADWIVAQEELAKQVLWQQAKVCTK